MAKLLKPLVVIVLLLGIAALCIQAIVLFPKRTLIKERTQQLENGVGTVVSTLKGSLPEETQNALPFSVSRLKIGVKEDLPVLGRELDKANLVAKAVLQGWDDTKTDLENTRQDLENTRAELENTKSQLEDARTEIVQLNDTIRSKNEELDEKSNLIATLEDEKSGLEEQVTDLTAQVEDLQDQLATMEEEKNAIQLQLEKCDKELNKNITMIPGTTAKIVYANADWNFVIIDIGSDQGAQTTAEMIIYRGENMIGKVRISAVRDNVSIAEVISDFQQDVIKEGDYVLY
jgi:predicted nuclease with TOPRIM domain